MNDTQAKTVEILLVEDDQDGATDLVETVPQLVQDLVHRVAGVRELVLRPAEVVHETDGDLIAAGETLAIQFDRREIHLVRAGVLLELLK